MPILRSKLYSAFYDMDPSPITEFIQWLASSYGISEPPRILDVGCGPGRMLLEFGRLGWVTVGMEPDPDYFAHAVQVAEAFENVTVKAGGFADIQDVEEFDVIAAINGPFCYLLRVEDRIDALQRMFQALKPGGVMFLEIANFLWILKNYREPTERTAMVNGRVVRLVSHHLIDFHDCSWTHVDEFFFDDPQNREVKVTKTHRLVMISPPELLYFICEQGFKSIRTYNSYVSRQSERLTGNRLMVSAQKPK